MINSFKNRMNKWAWVRIILLTVFSTLMLVNSMSFKSPVIGISASLAVLYISSVATSEIFFYKEKGFLGTILGLATLILITAMLGIFLILMAIFTEMVSLVSVVAVGLILCLISVFRKRVDVQELSEPSENGRSKNRGSYLLVFPFLLSVAIAVYALLIARTGEGEVSVWLSVPNIFLPVFFVSTLSLVIMLFLTEMNIGLKLALISVYSFLSHSLFLLVWYPGRYGDPWTYLGHARYVDTYGVFYAYQWLYSQRLIADIIRYKAQYALVVLLRRMFSLDIYWVHVFLIPLLWSLFAPIFSYKIAELLAAKKTTRFPLFCAIGASLFPTLIYSGTVSTTFSLGLLFLMGSVMFTLYWVNIRAKRFLLLPILAAVGSLFAHPQTGIFALVSFFAAVVLQNRLPSVLKILFIAPIFGVYPAVCYIENATFSLGGLLNLDNFLSFQFDLITLPLVFGFLGVMFSIRGKLVKSRSALVLFLLYVITATNYYVTKYGMKNAIVPDRLVFIADLFLLPFVGFGLALTANLLKNGFSRVKASHLITPVTSRPLSILTLCLLLSLLATSALYQAYPRDEITKVQPAAYEVEAVKFLDSNTTGRYIVLGDTNLATIAGGFLGIDYCYGASGAKGNFGMPRWDWWVQLLYLQMCTKSSVGIMEEAIARHVGAEVAYFVVSVREGDYFEGIVLRTSEVMPIYKVFGGGKLYVFKYPFTGAPSGPTVKVSFDDGTSAEIRVVSAYTDWSDVTYRVWLTGHSSYNISDYPEHWTFLSLQVNFGSAQFDNRSDINNFIYITKLLPSDYLEVTWHANNLYTNVGWKDDSFRSGWQTRPGYPGTILPNITSDGNVLSLSWNFTQGQHQYYYYTKTASVPTIDYEYVLIRWRSTGPVAYVTISYAPGGEAAIVRINSESGGWTVTKQRLWEDASTAFVTVGITNLNNQEISGLQTVYIDYILICGTG